MFAQNNLNKLLNCVTLVQNHLAESACNAILKIKDLNKKFKLFTASLSRTVGIVVYIEIKKN